jgi:8-oxo-dGTP pyrophosphatase MutT (NUDIX family)
MVFLTRTVPSKNKMPSGFPAAFSSYTPDSHCIRDHSYGSILLSPDGEIAIILGRHARVWSLPKGHGRGAAETPLAAAIRETKEEVGVDLSTKKFVDRIRLPSGTYFVYLLDEKPELKPEDTVEVEEAKWMPLSRLRSNRLNMDLNTIASQKLKRLQDLLESAGGATTPRNSTAQTPLDTFVTPAPSPGEPGEPCPLTL